MAMNPLEQTGLPIEEQFRSWNDLTVTPFDKHEVDPYTRTRVILMNGIEVESIIFSHQFHRMTDHPEIRSALARSRRVEAQQQKVVNGLNPGDQSPLETTIGYEQVAVDLTAWLARHEPDPEIRAALEFGLLEDFDHLYRYANLYDLIDGRDAAELTGRLTEIMPGRPTEVEHRHPDDDLRRHVVTQTVDPLTRLHILTIVAAEQQTMNFYMNHATDWMEPVARGLYDEIALIEEQHVTHYGSLIDPADSWLKQLVFHEFNEVYLYWSMLQQETDRRIANIWELHLEMELGQLQVAADLLRRFEGTEAAEILPPELPEVPVTFEENKEYVRRVLADQVHLRADGHDYVAEPSASTRRYVEVVNDGGNPSEDVIARTRAERGREYRDETEGEHPVDALRAPATAR
jgi:hypothetical protein